MHFILPRRFSEVFQISQDYPGTLAQQQAVRDALALEYGTPMHRLVKRLDQSTNSVWKRSYLVISFMPQDMFGDPNRIAIAGVSGVSLSENLAPSALRDIVRHEVMHIVDKQLLTPADRLWFMQQAGIDPNINTWNHNVQEMWAEAGRAWLDGTGWQELTGILLPE